MVLSCDYDSFTKEDGCIDKRLVLYSLYVQIAAEDYTKTPNLDMCSPTCRVEFLKQAYWNKECLRNCFSPECGYAMGLCSSQLSEKCEIGWGPADNQCLECKPPYKQYFSTCIETCPRGTEEYWLFPHMCVPREDLSSLDEPDILYVLEDKTKTVYHEDDVYFNFMDAFAAAWAKYTVIYLLGEKVTYRVNYMYSHLDNVDYVKHKEYLMADTTVIYLRVQSLPCSVELISGCYQGTTTMQIYPSVISIPEGKTLVFQDITLTTRQLFANSIYEYCPLLTKTVFGYEDDRGQLVENVRKELIQCKKYEAVSFLQVNSGAMLRLQDIVVQDFTIQLKAIILLEGGNATLSNVTFSNVQPGMSSPTAVVLSTHNCDPFDSCGSFTYQVGKVEYMNNGYELSVETRLNPFIYLSSLTSILIEDVVFQYNTLMTSSEELGLITIRNFLSFSMARCVVDTNVLLTNFLDLQPVLTLPAALRKNSVWSTTTHITLSHVTIRQTLAEKNLINIVMSQVFLNVLIEDCEFNEDALIDRNFLYIEYANSLTDRMINGIPQTGVAPNFIKIVRTSFIGLSSFAYAVSLVRLANIHLEDVVFLKNGLIDDMVHDLAENFIAVEGIYAQHIPDYFTPSQCVNMLQITNSVNSWSRRILLSSNTCELDDTSVYLSSCLGTHTIDGFTVFNNTSGGQLGAGLSAYMVPNLIVNNLKATDNTRVVFINVGTALTLTNSLFQDNDGDAGTAIYAINALSLDISNTIFRRNSSPLNEGGAIYFNPPPKPSARIAIHNCTFESNSAKSAGAISLQFSTGGEPLDFSLTDSTFTDNYASLGSSLAISSSVVLKDSSSIHRCIFKGEKSSLGVLSLAHIAGVFYIQNSLFDGCVGEQIAAINLQTGAKAVTYMKNVTISRSLGAPALHKVNAILASVLITTTCYFLENGDVALLFEGGYWNDTNSVFQYNMDTSVLMKSSAQLLLINTLFESNTGNDLSAAYYSSESSMECIGCVFRNNTAPAGSALVFEQFSFVTLRNCVFEGNTATQYASAISAQGTRFTPTYIYNTVFRYNTSPTLLLVLFDANLYLESVLIEHNSASEGSPCISAFKSTLTANNVTFRYQTGKEVPFLWMENDCILTINNSRLYEGSSGDSRAILLTNSVLKIHHSILYSLNGDVSAVLYAQGTNNIVFDSVTAYNLRSNWEGSVVYTSYSTVNITNCTFSDFEFGAVVGMNLDSLIVRNTVVSFGVGYQAAGLICETCEKVEIIESQFEHLNARYGGGIKLIECANAVLSNTVFKDNRADIGGGFYAEDSTLLISDSAFYANLANDTDGGGVYLGCPSLKSCNYRIINTIFEGNAANIAGGAVAWKHAKPELINVTTANNSAYYGPNYASFPTHLQIRSSRYLQSELPVLPPGQPAGVTISVAVLDHYNQTVLTDNILSASLEFSGSPGIVSGESKVTAVNGVFTFSNFYVYAPPNKTVTLNIITTGIPEPSKLDETAYNKSIEISVFLRECVPGESMSDYGCTICAKGTYGFDPLKLCQSCPSNAECLGSFQMYPNSGYWRSGIYSGKLWPCPVPSSCLGGKPFDNDTTNWLGFCAEGYADNICQSCAWAYSRAGKDKCGKCPPLNTNIVRIVFVVIAMVAYNVYQIWAALTNATKPTAIHSIYLKILTNYLQLVFLVTEFRLSWPQPVLDLFSSQESSGGVTEQLYSIECFLSNNGDASKVYFKKMVFMAILPAAMTAAIVLFWGIIAAKKKELIYLKRELAASLVIAFFFIHPTLTKALFSMFSCIEINIGELWLTIDLAIPCYDSEHYLYLFTVGIPAIAVWVFAVPLLCLSILIRNRRNLDELWLKLQYGFLINGYSRKRYYWEFVVTFRKIAVICCSVFLTNSIDTQALTVQAILIGFLFLQLQIHPYTLAELNSTEVSAILVAGLTIYCGLYYLTESLSEGSSWFFFILILLANVLFLLYWVVGFLGHMLDKVAFAVPALGRLLKPHLFERDPYIEAFIQDLPASNPSYVLLERIQDMNQLYASFLQSPAISSNFRPMKPQYKPSQPVVYMSSLVSLSHRQLRADTAEIENNN